MENNNRPLRQVILWAIIIPVAAIVISVFVGVAKVGFEWRLVGEVYKVNWILYVIVIAVVAIPCIFILSGGRSSRRFLVISLLVIGFVFIIASWIGNEISEVIRKFIEGKFNVGLLAGGITIMALAMAIAKINKNERRDNGMVDIPTGAPIVYVSFSAGVDINSAENLIEVMANCANAKVKQVYLLLSTPGGTVREGFNLYNVLSGMPFELVTHNVGNVDSIGSIVFFAGSKRYATQHSTFMFHGVGFNAQPNERFEPKSLEERLSGLVSDQKRIGSLITEYTKISKDEIDKLFKQGETKDCEFALEKGIVHEIREVKIKPGSPVIQLVFKRQK